MNIFITGVSLGLGKALTKEFLQRGHHVWGVARRKLDDWDTNKDFQSNENFRYTTHDISIYSDVERVCKVMLEEQFIPDIVILNAGIMENDLNGAFSYEIFKKVYQVNLFGAASWINIFLPIFLERNRGIFVAISSLSSYRGLNNKMIAYGGSKAALNMTFECFRLQLSSTGVRFITINPGRMVRDSDGNGLMRITYTSAAKKIVSYIFSKRSSNVFDFPLTSSVISKILRIMPDFIVDKMIKFYIE
jgi:3-oxoacyl-[acyl-carrier protein] reductase